MCSACLSFRDARSLDGWSSTDRARRAPWPGQSPHLRGSAVFDCETTGTDPEGDEIVSFALCSSTRIATRPAGSDEWSLPPPDPGRASRPRIRTPTLPTLRPSPSWQGGCSSVWAVAFVAHDASFDLTMLRAALRTAGLEYRPPQLPARSTPSACSSRSPRSTARSDLLTSARPPRRRTRRDARHRSNGGPREGAPRPRSRAGIGATRPRCLHAPANPRQYAPGLPSHRSAASSPWLASPASPVPTAAPTAGRSASSPSASPASTGLTASPANRCRTSAANSSADHRERPAGSLERSLASTSWRTCQERPTPGWRSEGERGGFRAGRD